MKSKLRRFSMLLNCGLALVLFMSLAAAAPVPNPEAQAAQVPHDQVIVPGEDRFTPFAQTIHAGEAVRFINMDTDDHTVVSLDVFNTAGNRKLNVILKGTDNNGGKPGTLLLHFNRPGTFVYYCRFHSHLDDSNQPVAPGPKQGIQDPDGNYGTPMMGIITVIP